jgi:hypothetical protein
MTPPVDTHYRVVQMAFEGSPAQFYRDQAKRIRALAGESKYPEIIEQLLTIAAQFERLAKHYDKGLRR